MAETTITGLPNATTPLAGTERVPMDQAGATKDATTQDIANLAPATDLTFTAATRTLASSTGADVVLPVATTTDAGLESAADKAKLDGVAAGATVNSPDATLLARANHTGTQAAGTITGLATVATTGTYADLSGKPTLGTAAATASTDYAPAAQGVTNGNSHDHDGGDGAQIAYSSLSGLPTLPTGTNTGDQTLANTSNATSHTVTLSGSGGSLQLVEGSNVTFATSGNGSAGVVTISASVTGGGGGTVTSIGLVVPTGFNASGSPVTTSGDITLAFAAGYSLPTTASQASWDTAFTERRYWDGGATGLTAATGRTSLGLGGAAVLNVGTSAGTVAAGDDSRLATDLTFDASTRLLSSSTGADVTLPLVTSATAGLAPLSGGGTTNFLRADGTWAAPAGGGGSAPAPGYQTFANGSLVAPMNCTGALGASNAGLQRVVYHPIYIPVSQTFTQILARTNTTYAGTTDIYLGVYSHDSTINRPSTKIYDSGLLQITASGQANYGPGTISLTLSPGFYWLAILASAIGATPAFVGQPSNTRGVGSPWFSEYRTDGTIIPYVLQASQSTLPSTAAATTPTSATSQPVVFLGV